MKFEDYLRQNRHKLDIETLDEKLLWAGISGHIPTRQRGKRFLVWKVAAAVIVLAMFSFFAAELLSIRKNQQLILAKIDPELAEQEGQLKEQIALYRSTLAKVRIEEKGQLASGNELKYIDELIGKYVEDLEAYGPNPHLLNSLMDLYRKKVKILSRMLNEIEKNKRYERKETDI